MSLTPPLNATGVYSLKAPFVADPNKVYTCIALREFQDLLGQSISVYDRFYAPLGLTHDDYLRDLVANEVLVTLYAIDADPIYVPTSYVVSFPDLSPIPYNHVILSASLGALPVGVDLSFMISKVQATISDTIGVEPDVLTHAITLTTVVTAAQHEANENARASAITERTTDHAEVLRLTALNAQLVDKLNTLEQWIIAHPATT